MKTPAILLSAFTAIAAANASAFTLVGPGADARVVVDSRLPPHVWRAAQDLTNDVKRISGADIPLLRGDKRRPGDIAVSVKPDGRWEAYSVRERGGALEIVGSDARGAMFGVYDFIERCLGVDPMYFWSGVPHPNRATLAWEKVDIVQGPPSFRFRGWFLNDEDFINSWKPYAGHRDVRRGVTFIDEIMNHETLEHVLEALVRSRYNMIIPSSYFDPFNPADVAVLDRIAARGIYVTQHHHDPLGLSGFVFDNIHKGDGKRYSYHANPAEMEKLWRRAARVYARHPDVVWQIGMRGHSDSPTWRSDPTMPATDEGRAAIISSAMAKQVGILKEIGVPSDNFHVTATLWAEGAYFNAKGLLDIPSGATVIFSDNSPGWVWPQDFYNVKRRADCKYGVYYHHQLITSGPHCATMIPVARTYKLLKEAFDTRANEYVVFNVGNVREFCYGIDSSAKMTWNMPGFDCDAWQRAWIARGVGDAAADGWTSEMNLYFKSFARHPATDAPCMFDGHIHYQHLWRHMNKKRRIFEGIFAQLADKIGKFTPGEVRVPAEPSEDGLHGVDNKDPMMAALLPVMHPPIISWSDVQRRAAAQKAGFDRARRLADALLARTPPESRTFASDQLLFPVAFMQAYTGSFMHLLDADVALDAGDKDAALRAIDAALDDFKRIHAISDRYCHGKWKGWWNPAIHQRIDISKSEKQVLKLKADLINRKGY